MPYRPSWMSCDFVGWSGSAPKVHGRTAWGKLAQRVPPQVRDVEALCTLKACGPACRTPSACLLAGDHFPRAASASRTCPGLPCPSLSGFCPCRLLSTGYDNILAGVVDLLESARRTSARAVNAIMTAAYWEIGRRIVECEQGGEERAIYGETIIQRLAADLTARFGRGFSARNLRQMRAFYRSWRIWQTLSAKLDSGHEKPDERIDNSRIFQTVPEKSRIAQTVPAQLEQSSILQTPSAKFDLRQISVHFPLPWSHYVMLLKVKKPEARRFYETEALRGGWSVRQLDRQISTLFYERTLASHNKVAMLKKGSVPKDATIRIG